MSSDIKIDASYKKLLKRQYTSLNKRWHEEFAGKTASIKFKDVWIDGIPETPPDNSTNIIQVVDGLILTEDLTVDNSLAWLACSTPDNLSSRIGDFIQPDRDLQSGYFIRVFDNTDKQVFVGDQVNWEFDYVNGILTFENQPSLYTPPFKIYGYRYIGDTGTNIGFTTTTLDHAYDGSFSGGSGRIINVDFGPVVLNPTNGSAALQINPVPYTPSINLEDGQIINKSGILYVYDLTRNKWLSMIRQNIVFGAKRADGIYLNLSNFSSNMSGWPALRDGTILGITAQSSNGYSAKQFKIIKHGESIPLFTFNLTDHYYANGNLNIDFDANELIKILASSEFGVAYNTVINLEIGWRVE